MPEVSGKVLVIHGVWAYGALQVWAEDSALPAQAPPRRGRPSRAPRPHPFAAPPDQLAEALAAANAGAGDLARKAVDDELTLRLPSLADGPLASPDLIRPLPESGLPGSAMPNSVLPDAALASPVPARATPGPAVAGRPALAAWRVPVLVFEPPAAAELLPVLAEVAPGELVTSPVTYLAAVARFAGDLVTRGRVLPVLTTEEDGGHAARWRVILSAADAQHARELASAMPPACRAAEGTEPGPLLASVLDALADAMTRARLPGGLLPARRGRRPARIPLAERTVEALTASDPSVEVTKPDEERDAAQLSAALTGWLASAALPAGSVRTCFRLMEPADAGDEAAAGDWRVEFSLQSADDPSLMMPAKDVWAGEGSGWGRSVRHQANTHPEEELLAGLGAAARLFPALDGALREAAPARVALDVAGALGFLRETAPLLSGAGFGVLLPDWARKARLGLRLTARSSGSSSTASARQGQFGMEDLVSFRYDLAVGDEVLSAEELAELARLKVPLVRLRGQWVELDDRHLKAALKFLERGQSGTMTAAEVLTAATGGGLGDLPLAGVDADGWLGDLLSGQADERLAPMETPAGFSGTLRPYQQRGLSWLSFLGGLGVGAILADDMGLGKTVQLLSLIKAKRGAAGGRQGDRPPRGTGPGATLLICPMSLTGNWQREAQRFTPDLVVHVHHGADRLSGSELAAVVATADLVITTYQVAVRDLAGLSAVPWTRVVCDEAQAIKNHLSLQSKAVRSLPAASRIALTGTPVENQLSELWSIMEFTNPGLLGPQKAFREAYAVPIERHGSAEAAERLRRITQPFMLRRLKTDKTIISDLPDKQEMKVWCNLTQEQATLYAATVTDMLSRIEDASDDISRRGLVLATMAKLKQVCNHPAHLLGDGSRLAGRSGKLARLEELCEEIVAEGDKALCFTQYAEFGRMLQPYLAARAGCPVLFLHGGTTKKQRDAMVARFQEADEPVLFLLSLKAGGTGLNLTAANHVIHVDRWWNPAVEDQATDRAFRIGQRRDVQVRKFVCVGTLEERIDAMIEQKKALAEQIVGTGEGWLTELSTAALREVLALSPDAVS
jgi:SNF2 family DNA or RNA helicase